MGKGKRILSLVLVMTMGSAFAGCGKKADTSEKKKSTKDKDVAVTDTSVAETKKATPSQPDFSTLQLSNTYLVGMDYCYDDMWMASPYVTLNVRIDQILEVEFYVPRYDGERTYVTKQFPLSDQQFLNIKTGIDLRELYELDPQESSMEDTMDGGNSWLFIYGQDDQVLKACGGFCPVNKRFNEMRRVIYENIPEEFFTVYDSYARRNDFYISYGYSDYGVFLSVESDLSQLADYEMVVIDAQYFTKEEIEDFKSKGHFVISYINIGAIENFRPYYEEYEDLALSDYEHWEDEKWVDVTSDRWQEFILDELAPSLLEKGVDGFFVDNCDVYDEYPDIATRSGLETIMKGLVATEKEVIMNGGQSFLDAYLASGGSAFDILNAINQEEVFTWIDWDTMTLRGRPLDERDENTKTLEQDAELGIYVFLLEYTQNAGLEKEIQRFCYSQGNTNFLYYISDSIELDGDTDLTA